VRRRWNRRLQKSAMSTQTWNSDGYVGNAHLLPDPTSKPTSRISAYADEGALGVYLPHGCGNGRRPRGESESRL
jgi:hypothetical protein